MMRFCTKLIELMTKPVVRDLGIWLLLVACGVVVLYLRYPFAVTYPNFYAEDGKDYVHSIMSEGALKSMLQPFNGYLIVGQYVTIFIGYILNHLFWGNNFVDLPKAIALSSYLVLAISFTLPWLLFRKVLGQIWAICCFFVLLFFPMGGWDYAILGTVGNLKFLFIYIATLLIIFRNNVRLCGEIRTIFVDIFLGICILTNITVLGILPLMLLRYKKYFRSLSVSVARQAFGNIFRLKSFQSLVILGLASSVYILSVWLHGVPRIEGYLQGPISGIGLINALYRSSWYAITYPLGGHINLQFVVGTLIIGIIPLTSSKHRELFIVGYMAILASTVGFIINRPGVTQITKNFSPDMGPAQFFYGGGLVFVFMIFMLASSTYKKLTCAVKAVVVSLVCIYIVFSMPFAGNRTESYLQYAAKLPTLEKSVNDSCALQNSDEVVLQIFPTPEWKMRVKAGKVCPDIIHQQ